MLASEANYRKRMNNLSLAQNQAQTKANILKLLLNLDAAVEILPQNLCANEAVEDFNRSLQKAFANRQDYKGPMILPPKTSKFLWRKCLGRKSISRRHLSVTALAIISTMPLKISLSKIILRNLLASVSTFLRKSSPSRSGARKDRKAKALVNFKLTERQITTGIIDR